MRTPICPNCGAKFAHDPDLAQCSKCGLPDEVILQGTRAIARWRRKPVGVAPVGNVLVPSQPLDDLTKRQRKLRRAIHGASASRRRYKHGRVGVGR